MGRSRRSRSGERCARPGADAPAIALEEPVAPLLPEWVKIGVVPLFLVACAFGVLEVHSSTDTWIALAAGRDILSLDEFPINDRWSYTFEGQTWFNQNWLSHVYFWLLYDTFGPNAVVYGTWLLGAGMFTFVLLATRLRSGSWLAGTLAGAAVGIASRDWLSARPATVQFFMLALFWLLLQALISQDSRRRWWAVALLLPAFLVWPHAHGSFLFGYALLITFVAWDAAARLARLAQRWWLMAVTGVLVGVVAAGVFSLKAAVAGVMYLAYLVFTRFVRREPRSSLPQLLTIVAIGLVTVLLGWWLSPYGFDNFTHPFKVTTSEVFRTVGEWIPPYLHARFPPVLRFWIALGVAAACPIAVMLLKVLDLVRLRSQTTAPTEEHDTPAASGGVYVVLFDLGSVVLGLGMVMFARRFAPIFYILAAPALVTWIVRLGWTLSPWMRQRARELVIVAVWPVLAVTVYSTADRAHKELIEPFPPQGGFTLLDRVTKYDRCPRSSVEFLRRNELKPHVYTEWTQAALLPFFAPGAQVFIDGRSQQVYTEEHYRKYVLLTGFRETDESKVIEMLVREGTDLALMRRARSQFRLIRALDRSGKWLRFFQSPMAWMYVHRDSALMEELLRRERAGELWWPDLPEAAASRGWLLIEKEPKQWGRAAELWQSAIARMPELGQGYYQPLTVALINSGQVDEAAAYLAGEKGRIGSGLDGMSDKDREQLLRAIENCEKIVVRQRQRRAPPAD